MITDLTIKGTLLLFLHENAEVRRDDPFLLDKVYEYLAGRGIKNFLIQNTEIREFLKNHIKDD